MILVMSSFWSCSDAQAAGTTIVIAYKRKIKGEVTCASSYRTTQAAYALILRFRGAFGYTLVSSATTKAVVSAIDNTERRYLSVTKTGSLIVSDLPCNNFMLNLHYSSLQSS